MPASSMPPLRGRRGNAAVDGLPSTAAFSNPALSSGKRALILLVLLIVAGRTGTLREISRKLLAEHAGDAAHWTHGRDEKTVSKRLADCLGRGARRPPNWTEIADLFRAYLPPDQCAPLLAVAAGVYFQAHGCPPPGYTGPIERPGWAAKQVVTADTIRTTIIRTLRQAPAATSGPAPMSWAEERSKLKETNRISSYAFMEVIGRLEDMQELLRGANTKAQRSEAARDLHRRMTLGTEASLLWEMAEDALSKEHPELSREEVRNLMYEHLRQLADDQLA
ncbi:hypothetical protein YIM_25040 [Amycolatopsis sp. YIM 10]|nr:hypothetical protein YIM_25040 [Amycolatopsis sp. YIM 10]